MTFRRRADRLLEILTEETTSRSPRPNPDVIHYLDIVEERRRLRFSRPNSSFARAELLELAIGRVLEKQGRTAQEISELLPAWVERFEHFDRQRSSAEDSAR
jgi:hypothetical protein